MKKIRNFLMKQILAFLMLAGATGIGDWFHYMGFPETNIVIIYLTAVLMYACLVPGILYGIEASILGTLTFNYMFTEPYFSLKVYDVSYITTFVIMTITALIAFVMTSRVRKSELNALKKEAESKALYGLTNHLTDAKDINNIAEIAVHYISDCFECQAGCLCFDINGKPEHYFIQQVSENRQTKRKCLNYEELYHCFIDLRTEYAKGEEFWDWPIYGHNATLGLLRIPTQSAKLMSQSQRRLLQSMIENIALAMDRFQSVLEQMKAHEETMQERYRGNLLRAISHDLRTPLASIMGTSEMIIDMTEKEDPRYQMAQGIHKDADWLHSLVENILNLTRLQDGRLVIKKVPEAVEEIVGGAVSRIMEQCKRACIQVEVPEKLFLVPMDARLMEQVLINLLDNALKHSKETEEITVVVKKSMDGKHAVFTVSDHGEGIPGDEPNIIFQAFYTSRGKMPDAKRGIGLGMTICQAIVCAHGGTIQARNRTEGHGTIITFTLPLEEKKDE